MARCSGCTSVFHTDSNCIILTGNGSAGNPLVATPRIDPTAGNMLTCESTGLRAVSGGDTPQQYQLFEDFYVSNISGSTFGQLGWAKSFTSPDVITISPGELNHPGIVICTTPSFAPSNNSMMFLGSTSLRADDIDRFTWVIRAPSLTNEIIRVGLNNDPSTLVLGASHRCVVFDYDPASSPNWRAVTGNAAAVTIVNTGVVVAANTWYELTAIQLPSGFWEFRINGVLVATLSTNLPVGTSGPNAVIFCTTNTAKTLHIDLFTMRTQLLGPRF